MVQRFENSLGRSGKSFQNLSANFGRYAQSLAARAKLIDGLLNNKTENPDQLFQQIVRGVFDPRYECGKTRVLAIDVIEDFTRELIELQLLQAVVRTELVDLQEIDIRADKALEVAQRHGGEKLLAKEPDTPILYMVDWSKPTSELIWHVIYGTNPYEAKLKVAVNASTGDFLRVEK